MKHEVDHKITFISLEDPCHSPYFESILELHQRVFDEDVVRIQEIAKHSSGLRAEIALSEDKVVGYKMGYDERPKRFYSWLGAVDPDFRQRGVAKKLMDIQHNFLRENGYKEVKTKTKNQYREMLLLNIKSDFDVIGCYTDDLGETKIILKKDF